MFSRYKSGRGKGEAYMSIIPKVYFGNTDEDLEQIDWRLAADDGDDSDEEKMDTPKHVIDMLGFDPKKI